MAINRAGKSPRLKQTMAEHTKAFNNPVVQVSQAFSSRISWQRFGQHILGTSVRFHQLITTYWCASVGNACPPQLVLTLLLNQAPSAMVPPLNLRVFYTSTVTQYYRSAFAVFAFALGATPRVLRSDQASKNTRWSPTKYSYWMLLDAIEGHRNVYVICNA